MKWMIGVTTVPDRRSDLLPRTLSSLKEAGFDAPRLFVDGVPDASAYYDLGLEVTTRWPRLRIVGNFMLGLAELYIRDPFANMFAMFQDDVILARNVRHYLDRKPLPEDGYLNLITYPKNQRLAELNRKKGFFKSTQNGLGAQGLVFTNEAVRMLLCSDHMVHKPRGSVEKRRWKFVDGGIVAAFAKIGRFEYCHNPGLIWHDHKAASALENERQPVIKSFVGQDFDALELLK